MKNIHFLKDAASDNDEGQVDVDLFAEILIKTCTNICDEAVLQNEVILEDVELNLMYRAVISGAKEQAKKLSCSIKEYFGVE